MTKEYKVVLAQEKDTELIINYIKQIANLEEKESNRNFITYINEHLNFPQYYSPKSIRKRKNDFSEEYFFIRDKEENVSGIIAFAVEYGSPVLNLNIIHIKKNDLQYFKESFAKIMGNLAENAIITPSKIRGSIVEEKHKESTLTDTFLQLGFKVEAKRKHGKDFKQVCTDYVYFLEEGRVI